MTITINAIEKHVKQFNCGPKPDELGEVIDNELFTSFKRRLV